MATDALHLGSGKDYKPGWFNVDILIRRSLTGAGPGQAADLAAVRASATAGLLNCTPTRLNMIYANNVLEHVADLPQLMSNCLTLLRERRQMQIEVPHEHARTAWQDPTHVRAMNENSWIYYTDWFWYLGWFEHRFQIEQSGYLDLELREAPRERAAFMRVNLVKVATTLRERMTARTMSPAIEVPQERSIRRGCIARARPSPRRFPPRLPQPPEAELADPA